ncbi:MAG: hypothetical protein IPO39_13675 [Bacteroidetes bacterium]|nr:hypothetical protein [Bacteroidota bacterium]
MNLIADSGSTKTEWNLVMDSGKVITLKSCGLNPYFLDAAQIADIISKELIPGIPESEKVEHIYFYGAGCGTPEKCEILRAGLAQHFGHGKIHVFSDLLGAARSLCKNKSGWVGILGTGSNVGFYNGNTIALQVPSLGYILGDDGSGVDIGKRILQAFLNNEMDSGMQERFVQEYKLSKDEIMESIYRRPLANRFIASFAPFAAQNKSLMNIEKMVLDAFRNYFEKGILKYPQYKTHSIHLTGSIAHYFSEEIRKIGKEMGIQIGEITQSPGKGLVEYHLSAADQLP